MSALHNVEINEEKQSGTGGEAMAEWNGRGGHCRVERAGRPLQSGTGGEAIADVQIGKYKERRPEGVSIKGTCTRC